jgi:glycosyltransferase involved in cell wall biosynthesis
MKLSIIVPAYNEAKTIALLLQKVAEVPLINDIQKELIVVDDGSKDNTQQAVEEYIALHPNEKILFIKQEKNQGKGAAIRKGIEFVTGDYVIIQDADLELDPNDYNILLQPLLQENLKVIYGSRVLGHYTSLWSPVFYLGGRAVTLLANLLYRQHLTDEATCYKLFETAFLKSIPLQCTGFEFCPEVTAKVAKRGIKIKEVPISYTPRTITEGKKLRWRDGLQAAWTLIKYKFSN